MALALPVILVLNEGLKVIAFGLILALKCFSKTFVPQEGS